MEGKVGVASGWIAIKRMKAQEILIYTYKIKNINIYIYTYTYILYIYIIYMNIYL